MNVRRPSKVVGKKEDNFFRASLPNFSSPYITHTEQNSSKDGGKSIVLKEELTSMLSRINFRFALGSPYSLVSVI